MMADDAGEWLTFTMEGLSVEELDELVVLLHQNSERVDEDTHLDVGTLVHTVHVFVQQHGDELKTGATLATALIGWLREWRKRVAAEKAITEAARTPQIALVRADGTTLRLRDASEAEVRARLQVHGKSR